ncbi:MAG: hypothetical protein R3C18_24135 [Planctomycetaceae bacterium]
MVTQTFTAQVNLQLLVAVLTFATLHVFIIGALREDQGTRSIGDDDATIDPRRMAFSLDYDSRPPEFSTTSDFFG